MTDTPNEAATEDRPMIHAALAAILADVPAIPKGQRNKQQGYEFRGIDDVMNALHPLFVKHQVVPVPSGVVAEYGQATNKNGTLMTDARLTLTYRFYAVDGSYVEAQVQGESRDAADKATNQASSSAFKYLLFQMFVIPLEGTTDSDQESPIVETWRDGHPEIRAKEALLVACDGSKKLAAEIWPQITSNLKIGSVTSDTEADLIIDQIPGYIPSLEDLGAEG